jgi:transcriptional regulator with XRE-family HTH domain
MAGMPKRRAIVAKVRTFGGTERIIDMIANGVSLSEIARILEVDRSRLSTWLHGNPDTSQQIARARKTAATALVEQGMAIVDAAENHDVQVAKLRAEYRKWVASKLDREQYGEQSGPTVAIQINSLHSGMLRVRDSDDDT